MSFNVHGKIYNTQKDALEYFDTLRCQLFASGQHLNPGRGGLFEGIDAVFKEYCRVTDYEHGASSTSYYVRNEGRGTGAADGSHPAFIAEYPDGEEIAFSMIKAIWAIASSQK